MDPTDTPDSPLSFPIHFLVISYVRQGQGRALREIGAFRFCDVLDCCVYDSRGYDPESQIDMEALDKAQADIGKSVRLDFKRVRVLPAAHILGAYDRQIAEQTVLAGVIDADRAESIRLAELAEIAANAPASPPEADPRKKGFIPPAGEEGDEEEVPPYSEWKLAELRAEVERRGLEPPTEKPKTKAPWIAILDLDDTIDEAVAAANAGDPAAL